MSFRGGFSRGRGNYGRGGFSSRGRGSKGLEQGSPDSVVVIGSFLQPCEADIVCKSLNEKIPFFNAPIYLENKVQIGKVDEIFGPINEVYFSVKPAEGIIAASFKADQKFYIASDKLLPLSRFLPKPAALKKVGAVKKKSSRPLNRGGGGARNFVPFNTRGKFRGAARGARGAFRGRSRGFSRGF